MTVGELIKEFVESKKLKKKDYKDQFGVSYTTIHKYYSNQRLPGYKLLCDLKYSGMHISKLFEKDVLGATLREWKSHNEGPDESSHGHGLLLVAENGTKYKISKKPK